MPQSCEASVCVSLPDISFENIRPHDGSRHAGFEELCSQLASLEAAPAGAKFHRKGRGADAGVECYRRRADGTEIGWQAKYLFGWDASLTAQLDDSIRTALDKHPQIVEYVVCLPFDLSDSRIGKGKTAREKWDDWCAKWKNAAAAQNRDLTITLWGKSELSTRLAKDDPAYSGRVLYWFGRETITAAWFVEQFGKARASLGTRYSPETNVELPIRQGFLAFARDPGLQKQIDGWFFRVTEEGCSAVDAIRKMGAGATETHSGPLAEAIHALTALLDGDPIGPDQPYPIAGCSSTASSCLGLAREALHWTYDLPPSKPGSMGIEPKRWAQHALHKLMEVLNEIEDALASNRWQLTNAKAVLLQGAAGIGKSHLLADIVEHQVHEGRPALLVLGSAFIDDDPWRQILTQLDRPSTEQIKHFLGCLDAAAQAAGTRAIVCIDALNERNGIDIWPYRLAAFLKTVEAFPRVGVILSCRSTYVPYVIPDELGENQLFRVDHEGFAADSGEAAKVYLDKRGIVRPGAPNLVPEFENPLFLKTCCDFLEKEGRTELPRGLRGVTSIFGFYNGAVTRSLNRRMKLDPHLGIVPKAIADFAQLLADAGKGYVAKSRAVALFESVLASGGSLEKSLLSQLESEGLLAVEPVRQDDGSLAEMVRFTFERFSDHAIAKRLLDDHLNAGDLARSFQSGQPLQDFVFGLENYKRAGIIEAIAIQLPERTGIEILDVGAEASQLVERTGIEILNVRAMALRTVRRAFVGSLLWREQSHFTDRTFELVRGLVDEAELNDLLISISIEPSNKFNALFVHKRLMDMKMPERDAFWSVYLAERGLDGPIETLISWAIQNGLERIDADRAYLAATMLCWFLTTSHRSIRDKATKALACILSRRLPLAVRLLDDFAGVNDLYALERLLAACYGAALQGAPEPGLDELAQAVFDTVFAEGKPPVNALLRDHAQGIIEYAAWRGALNNSIDITLARPPYQSPWPIEPVPDELIESYTEDYGRGIFRDAIVGSTVNDGDFARYQVDHKLDKWSPAKLGTTMLPTPLDVYRAWTEEFSANATAEKLQAVNKYASAAEGAKDIHGYQKTPETERLAATELTLKNALTSDQWEDFRVRGKEFIRYQLFASWRQDRAATFNIAWGRRWICKRAHEFGWTPELFGEFDRHCSGHDRTDHKVERIGKKYQWLAFHELVARMGDNLAYLGDPWDREGAEPLAYRSARQVGLRDIDPSLLVTKTHYDGWGKWGRTWWVPFNPQLRAVDPREHRAWLESDRDIINDESLIDLRNPKTGRRWLALWGFSSWRGLGVRDGRKGMQRDTWFRLNCIVVRRKDQAKIVESLQGQILTDPHSLPKIELHDDFYLGEYPWHPEVRGFDRWSSDDGWRALAVPCRPTVASYTCERSGYDCSIDRTVSIEIPAPWLAEAMGLRLASGRSPVYVGSDGREMFYDPSVLEAGPAAALVDRDAFLRMLDREGLSAIWVIAGEKGIFGGRDAGLGFGGRLCHTAIYHVSGDGFARHFHKEWEQPSEDQLKEFFGEEPVPLGIVARTRSSGKPARGRAAKND